MKKRIISGVIGAVLVILALCLRETFVLNMVVGAALVIAMLESQFSTNLVKNRYFIVLNCIFSFICAFIPLFSFVPIGILITALYTVSVVLLVLTNPKEMDLFRTFYGVGITLLVSFGLSSIMHINNLYN